MTLREATIADREAILALRARCFGDIDPEKRDPRFWDWEFGRARCFVGEDRGRLVSHLALVPVTYTIDGALVPGSMAVDAMTSPDARGQGWFSRVAGFAMESTQFTISTAFQIRSAVLGSMLRAGWMTAERVPVLVRPVWRIGAAASPDSARVPAPHPIAFDGPAIARTAEFLAWRFSENPHWKYRVFADDDGYLVARRTSLTKWAVFLK